MEQIQQIRENPLKSMLGDEVGTRGRDGKTYRVFFEKSEEKGKAYKGKLTIVIAPTEDSDVYTYVSGITYVPKFAVDDQALDWIIEKKLVNRNFKRTEMMIESGLGLTEGEKRQGLNVNVPKSPEARAVEYKEHILEMLEKTQ